MHHSQHTFGRAPKFLRTLLRPNRTRGLVGLTLLFIAKLCVEDEFGESYFLVDLIAFVLAHYAFAVLITLPQILRQQELIPLAAEVGVGIYFEGAAEVFFAVVEPAGEEQEGAEARQGLLAR